MSSVFHSSQHFLGLHKSVPWNLYSYFRIFLGIYININKETPKNRFIWFEFRRRRGMVWGLSMNWWSVDYAQCFWYQVMYFKETNADSLIKRPIFLVINSQLFLYNFSKFLYIFTLFIHPSTLNITNKTPHSTDDGSAEPKRYSVDWLCFSINSYFLFGLLVVNFSSQIVRLLSIIFFHIYIYIYRIICI